VVAVSFVLNGVARFGAIARTQQAERDQIEPRRGVVRSGNCGATQRFIIG
jgi:hypothetical protein